MELQQAEPEHNIQQNKSTLQYIFIVLLILISIALLVNNKDPDSVRSNVKIRRNMDYVNVEFQTFNFVEEQIDDLKIERVRFLETEKRKIWRMTSSKAFEDKIIELCNQFGCDAAQVVRVMYCESGGNPGATNGIYQGLFQHGTPFWSQRTHKYGVPGADIFDPYAQMHVTTQMFAEGLSYLWECQ